MMKEVVLQPPPRVTFNQWKDGSIHMQVHQDDIASLKGMFLSLIETLSKHSIQAIELEKQVELERFKMPPTKIEQLEQELKKLREEDIAAKTLVSGRFEHDDGELGPKPQQL